MSGKKLSAASLFLISAIVSTILGIICIANPNGITVLLVTITGISLILYGIVEIYRFFNFKMNVFLILGLILAALGIFCLINPKAVVGFIGLILGIFLFTLGCLKIKKSFDLRKMQIKTWRIWLVIAISVCIIGLSGLFNPANISGLFAVLIGFGFLTNGISSICIFFISKK